MKDWWRKAKDACRLFISLVENSAPGAADVHLRVRSSGCMSAMLSVDWEQPERLWTLITLLQTFDENLIHIYLS